MIKFTDEPYRDVCACCGKPTELREYVPSKDVCMACTLEDKEQGHRQEQLLPTRFPVRFRPFEPS